MSGLTLSPAMVAQPTISSRDLRRLAAAGALLVLLAGVIFSRVTPVLSGVTRAAPAAPTAPVAGRVLPVPGAPGTLEALDAAYRANFDDRGIHYRPAHATAALSIALTRVARGDRTVAIRPGAWRAAGAIAERTVSEGVIERATAASGYIEWDAVLSAPLAGHGDLAITASLTGVRGAPIVTTRSGHPAVELRVSGGRSVTLGEIVVRDATGSALYRALPTVTAGVLTMHVPARVLDGARYPLTIDPKVSSAVPVASAAFQSNPQMAFNGTQWLVVWQKVVAGGYDVYGSLTNADASGTPSPAFRISFRSQDEILPRVAWAGSHWLVVWQDNFSSTDFDIRGQVLDASGNLVGSEIPIATPTSQQITPSVAAGSGQFLVTWSDNRDGPFEIYARRIGTDGTPVDTTPFRIDESPTSSYTNSVPDVAWNGSKFLVVWEEKFGPLTDGSFVYQMLARVVGADASLGFENAVALFSQGIVHDPAVASDGAKFLVVWEQGSDVYGARVDPNTTLFTGEQIPVSTANDTQDDPVVTFNGGVYFVAWRDRRTFPSFPDYDIYAARVGTDGTVKDPNGILVSASTADEQAPGVAPATLGRWGVTYESGPVSGMSINVRMTSPK